MKTAQKANNNPIRIAIIAVVAVFVLAMGIWITTLAVKSNELQREYDAKVEESNAWDEKNAALDAYVAEENETALMEEYARKAGYVYPDERVYIQGS